MSWEVKVLQIKMTPRWRMPQIFKKLCVAKGKMLEICKNQEKFKKKAKNDVFQQNKAWKCIFQCPKSLDFKNT